jgi:hypothetical protein
MRMVDGVPHRLFQLKSEVPKYLAAYDVRGDMQRFLIFMRRRETQDAPITVILNWSAELQRANRVRITPYHRQASRGRHGRSAPRHRYEAPLGRVVAAEKCRSRWSTVGVDPPRRPVGDIRGLQ